MDSQSKYNCGLVVPSSCVPYQGKNLTILTELDPLPCDANMNDVVFKIDFYLKKEIDGNNLTELDKKSLVFDPATITPAGLHQVEIDSLDLLSGRVSATEEQLANLNIGTEILTIDLDTLAPDAAPCAVGTNQYSLISLLTLFKNEIILLKNQIANL